MPGCQDLAILVVTTITFRQTDRLLYPYTCAWGMMITYPHENIKAGEQETNNVISLALL